jgi:uncharacterized protein
MDFSLIFPLIALGAATGFLAGLLGIGGGMIMVPFITTLLSSRGFSAELAVKCAIATSLTTIIFTSVSSVRAHHKRGAVRWDIVKMLSPGIFIGALVGASFASALKGPALAICFAVFVSASATQMLFDKKPAGARQLPGNAGLLGAGGIIGVISAIVGAGGGFISVPFMTWCNVPLQKAVATSAALGFPIALAGGIGYLLASTPANMPAGTWGFVFVPALICIAAASVLTAPIGAGVAHKLPTKILKKIFACLLYALAGYMFYKASQV